MSSPLRDRLVAHITSYPGLTSYELARVLHVTRGQAERALMGLAADQLVAARRERRNAADTRDCWRWYPPEPAPVPARIPAPVAPPGATLIGVRLWDSFHARPSSDPGRWAARLSLFRRNWSRFWTKRLTVSRPTWKT